MRSFVEANQEIAQLNARTREVPGPESEPVPDFTGEWFAELVERAINGVELPDYTGVPDTSTADAALSDGDQRRRTTMSGGSASDRPTTQ